MKILLTGASGFIGSHLSLALLDRGDQVWAYRRAGSDLRRLAQRENDVEWFDIAEINGPFSRNTRIDAIIHAATCYGRNGEPLSELQAVNVVFPLRLLELGTAAGVKLFLNTDTYFNHPGDQPLQYLTHYVLTKHHGVECLQAAAGGNTKVVNLKLEHIYGPGDGEEKFVTMLLSDLLRNTPSIPMTPGEQKRDFIYITDAVAACLACLESDVASLPDFQTVSLGTGTSTSIRAFAELARRTTGSDSILDFGKLPYRGGEIMSSCGDPAYLRTLGWQPVYGDYRAGFENLLSH